MADKIRIPVNEGGNELIRMIQAWNPGTEFEFVVLTHKDHAPMLDEENPGIIGQPHAQARVTVSVDLLVETDNKGKVDLMLMSDGGVRWKWSK